MKNLELKKYRPSASKHCFILTNGHLVDILSSKYARRIALKIFDDVSVESEADMYKVLWGDPPAEGQPRRNTTLWEATQIQNIAAMYGLAPRVYGLETVYLGRQLRPAQVIELADPSWQTLQEAENVYHQIIELGKKYGFTIGKPDVSARDCMSGKLVDFQTFYFNKPYKETVRQVYCEEGKYGKVYYQDVPELELSGGPRKSELRIKELGLDKIDFKGKTVWDIGCAGGYFTRYAMEHGAAQVTGFDMKESVIAAKNVANYLGYFNISYEVADLREKEVLVDRAKPDIVLFLSLNYHIGIPSFLKYCPFVVFEDNGKETRHNELGNPWISWFKKIDYLGECTDHGSKRIYKLSNNASTL